MGPPVASNTDTCGGRGSHVFATSRQMGHMAEDLVPLPCVPRFAPSHAQQGSSTTTWLWDSFLCHRNHIRPWLWMFADRASVGGGGGGVGMRDRKPQSHDTYRKPSRSCWSRHPQVAFAALKPEKETHEPSLMWEQPSTHWPLFL